ncbi:MAG: lanthionine synthetase LanC family protein [Vicinamibacteria bacterium]
MGTVTGTAPDLEAAAARIVDALARAAVRHRRGATWAEPVLGPAPATVYRTGDATLYQGSAGVGWALADAARTLPASGGAGALAHDAIGDALARVPEVAARGLYTGRAGIGLAACKVGDALGDARTVAAGVEVLLDACSAPPCRAWDVIGGESGMLAACVAAFRLTQDERLVTAARRLADRLVRRSCETHGGRAWAQPDEDWLPLCGLAHGASGAAWALAELAAIGPARDLPARVQEALRYEAAWFDQRRNAWPDLRAVPAELARRPSTAGPHPTLWCHGSAGIGLARLRIHHLTGDWTAAAEAAVALQATCASSVAALRAGAPGHGLTLCHGHGGAAELFLFAHETLGEPEHLDAARFIVRHAIAQGGDDVERWPVGVAAETSYGLMTGLAGALCVTLRAAWPGRLAPVGLPGVGLERRRDTFPEDARADSNSLRDSWPGARDSARAPVHLRGRSDQEVERGRRTQLESDI